MSNIRTKPTNKKYRDGWEKAFGKRNKCNVEECDKKNEAKILTNPNVIDTYVKVRGRGFWDMLT